MNTNGRFQWTLLTCPLIVAGSLSTAPAIAQDEQNEEVVVTGSRIVRDEYSSAAPLQTFDVSCPFALKKYEL
jgi:hypothetical protein